MRSKIYRALAMLAVALIVSVPVIQAQNRVQADVPFAFNLQDNAMPAGSYQIIARDGQMFEVWNLDEHRGQLLLKQVGIEASRAQSPKMVFHKYGDRYFLSQIWGADSHYGIQFAESRLEKEVKMAAVHHAPETVTIAMK